MNKLVTSASKVPEFVLCTLFVVYWQRHADWALGPEHEQREVKTLHKMPPYIMAKLRMQTFLCFSPS